MMSASNSNGTAIKILTIDDERAVRRSIRVYLEDSGFEVMEAENGRIGVQMFLEQSPDLVLCDLRMPEVDGLTVLAEIRKRTTDVPIIIVSGTGVLGDAIEAVRLGAWDYILKPIQDMGALELAIHNALERSRLIKENRDHQEKLELLVAERTERLRQINGELQKDITERLRIESALRVSESRFRNVIEALTEGIIITDRSDVCMYVNRALAVMTGFEPNELIGRSASSLGAEHVRDSLSRKTLDRLDGVADSYETQLLRKDGSIFWVEISAGPYPDVDGNIVGTLSVVRDISEKKRAEQEREKLEVQLRRSQKLETIGTLAGGVAHDFNNILTPILGYAEIARMEKSLQENMRGHLEMIIQAALRAKELVKQILTFSRQGDQERQPFHLQIIVKEVMKLMRAAIPSTVSIIEDIDAKCDMVECDPTQIHQVLVNLATNSFHAMRGRGGTLEVKLTMIEADSQFACLHVNLAEGKYARLTVSDTGHGMDKATIERIFEPFFTTKDAGEGTGLGLSVVHGIVTAHGGGISVYSEPGKGTTFQIYLPCSERASQGDRTEDAPPSAGTEHVLFVDDERPNVLMGKQILEHLGYTVTICERPLDALELFKADPATFDLLITDQTMPQMTGDELLAECRKIRADIPAILLTGFSDTVTARNFGEYGFNAFGMKPIILKDFSRIVRKALQHATAVA